MIRHYTIFAGLMLGMWCAPAFAQDGVEVIERAREQFRLEILIEAVGIFWIAAEIAILFGMTVATRIFAARPLSPTLVLTAAERRQAILWGLGLGTLVVLVFVRHAFVDPLPSAFTAIVESGENIRERVIAAYNLRTHSHIALWCIFIAAWIALECAIVAQGVRAYGHLKRLTRDEG